MHKAETKSAAQGRSDLSPGYEGREQGKYLSTNPISRYLISSFFRQLDRLLGQIHFDSVLEAGCAEGMILNRLQETLRGKLMVGFDTNREALDLASQRVSAAKFLAGSVYGTPFAAASFDLVICSEVLEHLEDPHAALEELSRLARQHVLLSVPNEPVWRALNMARGAYWKAFGNTPGHINHWSSGAFAALVSRHFRIVRLARPLPWTLVLAQKKGPAQPQSSPTVQEPSDAEDEDLAQ